MGARRPDLGPSGSDESLARIDPLGDGPNQPAAHSTGDPPVVRVDGDRQAKS
jgi:hypothetical protein